jgi:hypothetical protein
MPIGSLLGGKGLETNATEGSLLIRSTMEWLGNLPDTAFASFEDSALQLALTLQLPAQ